MKVIKKNVILPFLILLLFSLNLAGNLSASLTNLPNLNLNSENSDSWSTILNQGQRIFGSFIKCVNDDVYIIGKISPDSNDDIYVVKYNNQGIKVWEHTWGSSNNDKLKGFAFDSFNNLYIIGISDPEYPENEEIFLLKYSHLGELLWSKFQNLSNIPNVNYHVNLIELGFNNSIYIAGVEHNQNIWNSFLIKLNSSGNTLWNVNLNISRDMEPLDIEIDSRNEICIYGGKYYSNLFLIKFNSSGALLWRKEWGEDEIPRIMKLDSSDNIILSGATYYNSNNSYVNWIKKLNSSGDIINEIKIGTGADFYNFLIWFLDNIYVFNGYLKSDPFLLKYDLNFNFEWNKSLSGDFDSPYYYSMGIGIDSQHHILLFYNNRGGENNIQSDIFILKLNSSGELLSKINWGGSENDHLIQIDIDSLDNLYLLCSSGYEDVWNIRTSSTFLVKNPKNNGKPPQLNLLNSRDFYILSLLGFTSLVSIIITLSIVKPKLKRFIKR